MTTITIFDGNNTIEVEVEDEFALTYKAMSKRDELDERRETRRHQSLNASIDNGFDFKDKSIDIEGDILRTEQKDELHNAIAKLLPKQQELVRKIYFEEMTIKEIATQEKVSHQAISDRLQKILKKIKTFLI